MPLLTFIAAVALAQQNTAKLTQAKPAEPVLWLNLNGDVLVGGKPYEPTTTAGASQLGTAMGTVYSFTGDHGGVLFPDLPELRVAGSMTISTWLFLRSYVIKGPNAQILFRGDDRGGYDPYSLRIEHDKSLSFQIQDAKNEAAHVKTAVPLGQWVHVVASFNESNGEMAIWLNGEPASHTFTRIRPFDQLDQGQTPGVGVGNLQHSAGDNEPLNGLVGDLRLYHGAWTPSDIGYKPIDGSQLQTVN